MTFEDLNTKTGQAIRRYLNGTVAVFNATTNTLLSYIVKPLSLYTGCVPVQLPAGASNQTFKCWNNTIRSIPISPLPATATEE